MTAAEGNDTVDDAQRRAYLTAMGIPVWQSRAPVGDAVLADSAAPSAPMQSPIDGGDPWSILRAEVRECTRCALHSSRTQTVFGVGNERAEWLIIGEAPGAEEDRLGEPFVGRAGKLLDNMLFAIGLNRRTAYIANVIKCRPPQNRDPLPDEVASCAGYLRRQIQLIKPKLILAVGRVAAHDLLKSADSLANLRGKIHTYPGSDIPVIVTYHPAYLLRSPGEKHRAWEDLKFAVSVYNNAADHATNSA